ncbi:MAG: hypothetical protein HY695_27055 [Deltaproteobacteria bacterium]|nr:hypothetical protein [Deltaproteobacteria bacterium]
MRWIKSVILLGLLAVSSAGCVIYPLPFDGYYYPPPGAYYYGPYSDPGYSYRYRSYDRYPEPRYSRYHDYGPRYYGYEGRRYRHWRYYD